MEPKQFQLEGQSLSEIADRVRTLYGPDARIVSAERVTVGGVKGFFSKQHYEVTVEESAPTDAPGGAHGIGDTDLTRRLGIAALLDDADDAEALIQEIPSAQGMPDSRLSTSSADFAAIMDNLTTATGLGVELDVDAAFRSQTPVPAPVQQLSGGHAPLILTGAGDLILIAGMNDDALSVATAMAATCNGLVKRAGVLGTDSVGSGVSLSDRRGALAARAAGVENDAAVFVAWGLPALPIGSGRDGFALAAGDLGADQAWVAVDAGRKPADTAVWVAALAAAVRLDALAAVGVTATQSPETIRLLGVPVGWVDDGPATHASLPVS
ncbi:hypothetical protein [Leifsonia sp. A12D58]|uniref:hypothetical protein n=1 Tax=Leifsonia sp. A12D58 TaxID=3397674 RepID=UPI0039E15DBE